MFAIDEFIGNCQGALGESHPAVAIRELLARALSAPAEVAAVFEPPTRAELIPLYASSELTVLRLIWAPGMRLPPHNHLMWAVIGIYGGEEHNRFYRRTADGLVPSGGKSLCHKDTCVLGEDTIHAVTNPSSKAFTGSLHVYGGDFLNKPRNLWNSATMAEEAATGERMRALFDAANDHLRHP